MASYAPTTGAPTRAPSLPLPNRYIALGLVPADRKLIAAEIERLIDLLDSFDGDPDLEDDDPAGDPLDVGEAQASTDIMATPPVYGIDQTRGPTNKRQAYAAHRAELLGLERSPTGGWRVPA